MHQITIAKGQLETHELCKGKAACLYSFATVIFAMDFYARPNYDALQDLLFDCIDLQYDTEDYAEYRYRIREKEPHSSKMLAFPWRSIIIMA